MNKFLITDKSGTPFSLSVYVDSPNVGSGTYPENMYFLTPTFDIRADAEKFLADKRKNGLLLDKTTKIRKALITFQKEANDSSNSRT